MLILNTDTSMTSLTGIRFAATLNLRNGNVATIQPATRTRAIPDYTLWPNVLLPADQTAISMAMVYIRDAFGRLATARIARPTQIAAYNPPNNAIGFNATRAGAAHVAGTYADWAATVAAANANAELRANAIALGATRVGIHAYWRITANEIRNVEQAGTDTVIFDPAIAANPLAVPVVVGHPDRVILPANQSDALGTITMMSACAMGMDDLSEAEQEFAAICLTFGAATIPLAGCELLETGHHYLSSNTSPTDGVERQFLNQASDDARNIWQTFQNSNRDMVWHKAAHPIDIPFMCTQALSMHVKERMGVAGLGSVAFRLPYVESTVKGARAMVAIYNAIAATTAEAGYVVQIPKLRNALEYIETYNAATPAATETGLTPPTRFEAIEYYLKPIMEEAGTYIAWCAGMYRAICEEAGASVNANTLLRARSITRVMNEHIGSTASGHAAYDNYRRFVRRNIQDGRLPIVNLVYQHVNP